MAERSVVTPKPIRCAKLFGDIKKASRAIVVITEIGKTLLMKAERVGLCKTTLKRKQLRRSLQFHWV